MVKIETRLPIEGRFGSEFPAICNHCRVMVAWSCNMLKIFEKFCVFFVKKFLMVKFSKFSPEISHGDTDRCCCVQISWNLADRKYAKSCVAYLTKTNFKLSLLRWSHPKSARASSQQCARSAPPWNPSRVSLITISARMSNKYGERTQPCRTPFLTRNHFDSVPATLTLASRSCTVWPASQSSAQDVPWPS